MSTNRTPVQLLAIEAVASAEAIDLLLDVPLLSLKPRKLGLPLRERAQVLGNEAANGAAPLRRADPRGAIDVVGNGNSDIRHCASQYHRHTVTQTTAGVGLERAKTAKLLPGIRERHP